MKYVGLLPAVPNVCSYTTLAKMNCKMSTYPTTDTGFILQNFFCSQAQFRHTPEEWVKIHVAIWHHRLRTSEFLYLITNHATDATKESFTRLT